MQDRKIENCQTLSQQRSSQTMYKNISFSLFRKTFYRYDDFIIPMARERVKTTWKCHLNQPLVLNCEDRNINIKAM